MSSETGKFCRMLTNQDRKEIQTKILTSVRKTTQRNSTAQKKRITVRKGRNYELMKKTN